MITDKVVFLTGASRGIGRELALRLATQQNHLGLLARNETELKELQSLCLGKGAPQVRIFAGDVSDEGVVKAAMEAFIGEFGRLDFLINNAGFGIFKPVEEIGSGEWDEVMDVNVKGTFLCCRYALPAMKSRKQGHIINIASDVAKRTFPVGSLYCASKYAQDAFSSALRKEVHPFGIKVSVVYSGLVDTHFHSHPQGSPEAESWLKGEDMADAIHYIMAQPPHVVIDELMIHPLSQAY